MALRAAGYIVGGAICGFGIALSGGLPLLAGIAGGAMFGAVLEIVSSRYSPKP